MKSPDIVSGANRQTIHLFVVLFSVAASILFVINSCTDDDDDGRVPTATTTVTQTQTSTMTPTVTPTVTPTATVTPTTTPDPRAGTLYAIDTIVGYLRFVPATGPGGFVQGSPEDEPCRTSYEDQFIHILTRDIVVMETEVCRRMWSELKAVQPDLPDDPTNITYCPGMSFPVQEVQWCQTVLFANILSLQQGLTRCYYTDATYSIPVDASNYTSVTWYYYYCDFSANGYRLPTEGEWEYFTRAGSTGPFSCDEPNYNSETCGPLSCVSGTLPTLEQYAVFCATYSLQPVGSKLPNPWNLMDVHGNVGEWCWDPFSDHYPSGTVTDYAGGGDVGPRACRSWKGEANRCRSADRYSGVPYAYSPGLGFRLVRTIQ